MEEMSGRKKRVLVVGAGVAGLTVADKLGELGYQVVVVEKEKEVGGLARSFYYKSGFVFDIGPHRFHTDDKGVMSYIKKTLGTYLKVDRSSGVQMFGKYFDWPLKSSDLLRMPLGIMIKAGLDLFTKKGGKDESFESYIKGAYGDTLFNFFFEPYHKKFLKLGAKKTHSDWAKAGVNRAVIDEKVKAETSLSVLKSVLIPKPVNTVFIYPKKGGIDTFVKKQASKIKGRGGSIYTESEVKNLLRKDGKIILVELKNKKKVGVDLVIWTAPIGSLTRLLRARTPKLDFLSTIIYNVEVKSEPLMDYQWCYFGSKKPVFVRTSVPSLFASHTSPKGKHGICVELTCLEGDNTWEKAEKLIGRIKRDLVSMGCVKKDSDIENVYVERISSTYPVYDIRYREKLEETMGKLGKYENLVMLGRSGMFWYNNMDHSIRAALDLAEEIKKKGVEAVSLSSRRDEIG